MRISDWSSDVCSSDLADPLFAAAPIAPEQLERAALQQPQFADQFVALHAAYRRAGQRLQIIDEALTGGTAEGRRLPWEEVRDWFHDAGNYVASIDESEERLVGKGGVVSLELRGW